tara:strand:+ start:656 stop:2749 length:2094 start_codon:yes stop_codon:yes gene_type:complete
MRKFLKIIGLLLSPFILILLYVYISSSGIVGSLPKDGELLLSPRLNDKSESIEKQIFFGDLHVHTTFSQDAFLFSLPMLQGEGAHPPSDACNFARFCSSLDFFSITDHAEGMTQRMWEDSVKSIRNCDAVSDESKKDLIVFAGWEWTQMGTSPENHYGHKNVILKNLDNIPRVPIGAGLTGLDELIENDLTPFLPLIADFPPEQIDFDFLKFRDESYSIPFCDEGNSESKECKDRALTPRELFNKIDELGLEALVIPHGTTWGIHSPPNSKLSSQLFNENHDPDKQRLIEVYSGHGNSEIYKNFLHTQETNKEEFTCPLPTNNFEPCCWRAGEIVNQQCIDETGKACEDKAEKVRNEFASNASSLFRFSLVEGATQEDWKQCGQLQDSFLPAYTYRPKMSAQAALASQVNTENVVNSFKLGLIGSTDNHKARAGAGYKEFARKAMGDSWGAKDNLTWILPPERGASFYSTGGLVAVHAGNLDREEIYGSLYKREVYATSGERILLWFNLKKDNEIIPMGSETSFSRIPVFEVKAVGSYKQMPGCPDYVTNTMSKDEISRLCLDECYNPSNERNKIDRIEIVKITPTEKLYALEDAIQDPWQVFECEDDGEGCSISFEDADYTEEKVSSIYYVRAIQEETLAVGGDPLRCEFNSQGECIKINPCYASGPDFNPNDDCLAPIGERAWSSPIFLNYQNPG